MDFEKIYDFLGKAVQQINSLVISGTKNFTMAASADYNIRCAVEEMKKIEKEETKEKKDAD